MRQQGKQNNVASYLETKKDTCWVLVPDLSTVAAIYIYIYICVFI